MVLQAFVGGRRWWYALGAHPLLDFTSVAVLRLTAGIWGQQAGVLLTERLVTVDALLATQKTWPQWSRPPAPLCRGVRPNSPGPTGEQAGAAEEPPA
jgi:hypothetical protein